MEAALQVDILGYEASRAGAHAHVRMPGKYAELTSMSPQKPIVTLKIEPDGTPKGDIAIGLDPFHERQLKQRREILARKMSNPAMAQAPAQPRGNATLPLFTLGARRARQRMSIFGPATANRRPGDPAPPPNSAMTIFPARPSLAARSNRTQLRIATAQPMPQSKIAKHAAEMRELEAVPTNEPQIPARDLRLHPEYLRQLRQQRMMALGYG